MPSLIRFLMTLMVLAGLVYAGMFALTVFVEPNPREMTVRVPRDKINPRPVPRVPVTPTPGPVSTDNQ
ncbi:MAG: histidine kinase [Pseudomonadota bacterium]